MKQNLVTIARYRDLPQAGLDKSILEGQGIPCFLDNEFTVGVNWLYSNALGGVKLKVLEEDVAWATKLIGASGNTDDAIVVEGDLPPEELCPKCDSPDIRGINYTRKLAAVSLLLSLPLFFFIKRFRCSDCGHQWR